MKRLSSVLLMFFALVCMPLMLGAQDLIPAPKKLELKKGMYKLKSDSFQDLKSDTKILSRESLVRTLKKNKLDTAFDPGEEGYILNITPRKIKLLSLTDAGAFYGMQTLTQLMVQYGPEGGIPAMDIYDKPDFKVRAWQDDISRGPIPTMDMLKEQIRTMAGFKLNYFTLYTEHVFKLKKHPGIAPKDGISREELKELTEYAREYHVKLIGNYQSFGHMEETLKHPDYKHLAENDHIISPALEESYDFLADVYQEMVPEYDGKYFNINCDETFGLGEGRSKSMVDSIGVSGVYSYHINRLNDILKKYNKSILMWGDIAVSYPEIVPQLPGDITVMPWAYHREESFDKIITPITDQGLNFWVAPGVSCWQNIFPDMNVAMENIYNFTRDGYRHDAEGVLNTSWDDDGFNFLNTSWHGFAWGAECSWNAPEGISGEESDSLRADRFENFNKAFDRQYFGMLGEQGRLTGLMLDFAGMHWDGVRKLLKNQRFFEPVFPIHYDYVKDGKREQNLKAVAKLAGLKDTVKDIYSAVNYKQDKLDYVLFALNQAEFTLRKNLFRIDLKDYLAAGENTTDKTGLKAARAELVTELSELSLDYTNLWKREYRNYWLDKSLESFDILIKDLNDLDGYTMIDPTNEVNEKGRKVIISSVFNDYPIHYEINSDSLSASSPLYTGPIYINSDSRIIASSFDGEKSFNVPEMSLIHHKAVGSLYKLNTAYSTYHPAYDGGGEAALVDGRLGTKEDVKDGKWQGYGGKDIDIELDMEGKGPLNSFSMGFYQNTRSWVIFPGRVEIYTKDGENMDYELFTIIKGTVPPEAPGSLKENYIADLEGISPKYIKVIARNYGKLPEWHPAGSGFDSMMFSDEIIIK